MTSHNLLTNTMKSDTFKTSISLPGELNRFVEEVMGAEGHGNRSRVIQKALRLLRRSRHRSKKYLEKTRAAARGELRTLDAEHSTPKCEHSTASASGSSAFDDRGVNSIENPLGPSPQ